MSPGRQIKTSPGQSNRIFRGRPGEVGGGTSSGRLGDQYLPAGYVFIKDFNRLMFSRKKHKDKKHHCMSCLQSFTTEEILSNHKK